MDEGQNILDATEYILMAINNIKNFRDFQEYKNEITTALLDIRNSIQNLLNSKKLNSNQNFNNDQSPSQKKELTNNSNYNLFQPNENVSGLSSMLGLKFNYDSYFKASELKNLMQSEAMNQNRNNQYQYINRVNFNQNNFNPNKNYNEVGNNVYNNNNDNNVNNENNENYYNNKNINYNNNFNNNNDNYESTDNEKEINYNNDDYVSDNNFNLNNNNNNDNNDNNNENNNDNYNNIYNNISSKSYRNKLTFGNPNENKNSVGNYSRNNVIANSIQNFINLSKKQNLNNNKNNQQQINNNVSNQELFNDKRNKKQIINNENLNNNNNQNKKKLSLIADIIMKINSEEYIYDILTKLFGDDLTDKLMSNNVSDDLIEAVQNSIKEIESLKNKDNPNSSSFEEEEKPKRFPVEKFANTSMKRTNKTPSRQKSYKNRLNDNSNDFDFVKSLRNQGFFSVKRNSNKSNKTTYYYDKDKYSKDNCIRNLKQNRPFINATCGYGKFFDEPLQKGGFSKLDKIKK